MIQIPIEFSARHAHLNQADWQALFGAAPMTKGREISQPPQFVAAERIDLAGPKGQLQRVGIVGPVRPYTQVELSTTDARQLGLQPPIAPSGHLDQAATVTMIGPAGKIERAAAILQQRHIHASPEAAARAGLTDGQEVSVEVAGLRGGVFDHVLVRVDPSFTWTMHIDTDEANAFGLTTNAHGTIHP